MLCGKYSRLGPGQNIWGQYEDTERNCMRSTVKIFSRFSLEACNKTFNRQISQPNPQHYGVTLDQLL